MPLPKWPSLFLASLPPKASLVRGEAAIQFEWGSRLTLLSALTPQKRIFLLGFFCLPLLFLYEGSVRNGLSWILYDKGDVGLWVWVVVFFSANVASWFFGGVGAGVVHLPEIYLFFILEPHRNIYFLLWNKN